MGVERRRARSDGRQPLLVAPRSGLVALSTCLLVRVLLYATGTRFSTSYLTYGWQLVPAETLRRDPFGSVWFLHMQPPLFNLMVGVLLRWSPAPEGITFQLVWLALVGLTILVSHDVLVRLGAPPSIAAVATIVVFCDPDWLRYELTPQYEVPAALLIVVVVWAVLRLTERATTGRWLALSGALTAIVLMRSPFHPVWLVAVLLLALWSLRGRWRWREVALALALPLLLVGGWLVKNQVLFGQATLSSWFGMNLQRAVISPLTPGQLDHLVAKGTVSELATVHSFNSYADYAPYVSPCQPEHGQKAVSRDARANGVPNFNYECYLAVYDRLSGDARAAIVAEPARYLYGRGWALEDTFSRGAPPGLDHSLFHTLDDVYRIPMLDVHLHLDQQGWAIPLAPVRYLDIRFSPTLAALAAWWLVVLGREGWAAAQGRRGRARLAKVVAAFTVVWVIVVGALFEIGENARFRIMVHPLLVGVPVAAALTAWASARRGPGHRPDSVEIPAPVPRHADGPPVPAS